jgi:tRNA nucleotidyltransferase/poly(A) polymerase
MVVKRTDYTTEAVEAAHSVLLELSHLLGEYRDRIVIVGGWVPELLLGDINPPHIGSLDVDLALDHRKLSEEGYRTILQLLDSQGYKK